MTIAAPLILAGIQATDILGEAIGKLLRFRYESASLPVTTYFFRVCPCPVRVTAATAAMSRVSTNGILPSPEEE